MPTFTTTIAGKVVNGKGAVSTSKRPRGTLPLGAPIEGATVRARKRLGAVLANVVTDVDGEFEFDCVVSPGDIIVLRIDKDPGFDRLLVTLSPIEVGEDDRDVGSIQLGALPGTTVRADDMVLIPTKVEFLKAQVFNDTDLGPGELYFRFLVNGVAVVSGPHIEYGADTIPGAPRYDPVFQFDPVVCSIPMDATEVRVQVAARDDDWLWGNNNPWDNPSRDYQDMGTSGEAVFGSSDDYGRGAERTARTDMFEVTYRIV